MRTIAQSPHRGGRCIARGRQLPSIRDLGAGLALLWIVVFAGSAGADTPAASSFDGGNGSQANPFQISTLAELRLFMQGGPFPGALSNNQNYFKLTANIDAADTSTWLGGLGWQPVAWTPLNSFDGQNFEIQNLTINRPTQDNVGFISTLGGSCCDQVLQNIKLVGGTIAGRDSTGGIIGQSGQFMMPMTNLSSTAAISGNSMVGGLIGATNGGTLSASSAGGSVTGTSFGTGGLIGSAGGTSISSTHATGHVTGTGQVGGLIGNYTQQSATPLTTSWASGQVDGDERVGGLLGTSTGKVTFSFAMGAVTATGLNPQVPGNSQVGGLIGNVTGNQDTYATEDCYATGSVTAPLRAIGGLIGSNSGSISRCSTSAAQTVTGTGASSGAVGGLVGSSNGTINSSRAAGAVNVSGTATNVGGLVGEHVVAGTNITGSYATGNVTAANSTSVGGLIGSHGGGTVNGTHATGNVTGGAQYVGGLIGFSTTPGITNSYATGNVSGGAYVGGLIGNKGSGSVNTAFATGSVTGTGDNVGGLIGSSSATSITKTWAKPGAVSGQNWVGGLVGNHGNGPISLSFAANNVSGSGTFYVGGLVGEINSNVFSLSDCYAKGTVTGSTWTGGLAGRNDSNNNVTRCYASGTVNGSATTNGAFIGDNQRSGISNNFWNAETAAPQPGFGSASGFSTGATGLTSAQMKQQAQFTTFDFSSVWGIMEGTTEPYLLWAAAGLTTTTTVLLSTANPSVPGQSVVFAAIINGSAPTGTVVFQDGINPIAGCTAVPLSSGQAQCTVSGLTLGSNSISAVYSGDFNNTGSISPPVNQLVVPPSLDADYSVTQTKYDALTDGLLIVRYMYNLVNNALTAGVLGPTAGRTNPAAVKIYLDAIRPLLDIDGNGVVDPATDGLLIMRYLLGVRGDKLIDSAVDLQNGARTTANDIETYIQTLMP